MITIEKEEEIYALSKVLGFVKFKSDDYESHYLAASPIVSDLLKRFSELAFELSKKRVSSKLNFDITNNIEDHNYVIDIIKVHIKHTDNWNDLKPEQKVTHVKVLISPYKSKEEIIENLIKEGDKMHLISD